MTRLRPLAVALSALLLTACANKPSVYTSAWPASATTGVVVGGFAGAATGAAIGGTGAIPLGAVLGAVLGGGIGAAVNQPKATQALENAGIQVIQLGDLVEVILPADLMFEANSTEVKESAYPLLDQVIAILNRFCQIDIKAVGHSDIVGTNAQQISFSKLQAQSIVTYLWTHGIPLNRLSFVGVGTHDDVATYNSVYGNGYNRRIVLIFWRTMNTPSNCKAPATPQLSPFVGPGTGYG